MLTFDAGNHEYKVDGVIVPSVTQIINSVAAERWENIDADKLEYACQRGTAVHLITELHDLGTLDESSVDPKLQGYVSAYKAFLADIKPSWGLIEHKTYSDMPRYAGTVDRFGTVNGKKAVLDIKTGVKSKYTGLQLAAYAHMIGEKKAKRYGLYLGGDGKYSLVEYKDANDWNVFLSCLNVMNFKQKGE